MVDLQNRVDWLDENDYIEISWAQKLIIDILMYKLLFAKPCVNDVKCKIMVKYKSYLVVQSQGRTVITLIGYIHLDVPKQYQLNHYISCINTKFSMCSCSMWNWCVYCIIYRTMYTRHICRRIAMRKACKSPGSYQAWQQRYIETQLLRSLWHVRTHACFADITKPW